jgi:hypothetical protein
VKAKFRQVSHAYVQEYSGRNLDEIIEFDFDGVSALLGEIESSPDDVKAQAAEMFSRIMVWIWTSVKGRQVHNALVRFTALTSGLRPDLVGNKSYEVLAKELGVKKQSMSATALRFSDIFKIKLARSRKEESRETMARAQRGHPNRHFANKRKTKRSKL